MKQLLLILAFMTTFGFFNSMAQQSSFYLGARGGANISKYKFTEDLKELYPTSNGVFGMNGGFDMGLRLSNWTISTGVHYLQKGGQYQTDNFDDNGTIGYFTAEEKLHFISVPVHLGYREYLASNVGWMVSAGPSFNFGLDGKLDETTEYFGTDETDFQNYKIGFGEGVNEDYKGVQVGFQLSPGLFVDINNRSKLTFNVTWDFGTKDIFNPRYKDANDFFQLYDGNQISRSTMFTVGYEYHFNFADKY